MTLHCGDSLAYLKTLPDNSVDAVVTDPPYGLGNPPDPNEVLRSWLDTGHHEVKGGGFMGKEWDAFVPQPAFWKEVYRVLKPGGHVAAFFGTRTYDWGTMAIRLAGFEVRTQLTWVFGCLSDDTEVLTERGWMRYDRIRRTKQLRIFAYNPDTDTYALECPSRWSEYWVNDSMYRIESDSTDQLVTSCHRCLVERDGELVFQTAEQIRETQVRIPVLEGVQNLQFNLRSERQVRQAGTNVFKGLRKQIYQYSPNGAKVRQRRQGYIQLRDLRERDCEEHQTRTAYQASVLQHKMQRRCKGGVLEGTRTQRPRQMEAGIGGCISGTHDRGYQSGVERWRNLQAQKGILQTSKHQVCTMPGQVYVDGTKGRVRNRVPFAGGYGNRQAVNTFGNRASYRPQPAKQQLVQPHVICDEQRPQVVRGGKTYSTTLATVRSADYTGLVFCPTVSTGAFVARRNGKVFLTGNSGFPKGNDIGRAIDLSRGGVGEWNTTPDELEWCDDRDEHIGQKRVNLKIRGDHPVIYTPADPEAAQWKGWNTQLKPAHEPICLARKPISEGTVAANVLKWRTGALNIGACRVGTGKSGRPSCKRTANLRKAICYGDLNEPIGHVWHPEETGRYPATLLHDGSEAVTAVFPVTKDGSGDKRKYLQTEQNGAILPRDPKNGIDGELHYDSNRGDYYVLSQRYNEEGSAARYFNALPYEPGELDSLVPFLYCAKASASERNAGLTKRSSHPTVKPIRLMEWLCNLLTPPGGTILDPFMGSGTTGIAAGRNGFDFIGCELQADYHALATERIAHWTDYRPELTKVSNPKPLEPSNATPPTAPTLF